MSQMFCFLHPTKVLGWSFFRNLGDFSFKKLFGHIYVYIVVFVCFGSNYQNSRGDLYLHTLQQAGLTRMIPHSRARRFRARNPCLER